MSHYPYGYPFPGQQSQQQYPPYQPYAGYPHPTGYATQPPPQPQQQPSQPPNLGGYYTASQSAYDYNSSSIPGLGTPSTGSAFPVPFNGSWSQGSYGTVAPPTQYPAYNPPNLPSTTPFAYSNHHAQAPVLPDTPQKPQDTWRQHEVQSKEQPKGQSKQQQNEQPKAQSSLSGQQEEGEISDPDFDDLYDDASNQPSATQQHMAISSKTSDDLAASGSDQEPNFYDTDKEEVSASKIDAPRTTKVEISQNFSAPEDAERDRSRSYSPYLSPREIRQETFGLKDSATNLEVANEASHESTVQLANPGSSSGTNSTTQGHANGDNQSKQPMAGLNAPTTETYPAKPFASLPEAHNEAKKAILRLLPHGVKYKTYIDEGFDEKVVKNLFLQLNLPIDPAVSVSPEQPVANQEKENQGTSKQPPKVLQVDSMAKKQEERKDKIARLLAEKKAKAAVMSSNAEASAETKTVASTPNAVPSPITKPSTRKSEMDLLLQQKIENLRKMTGKKQATAQVSRPNVGDIPTTPSLQGSVAAVQLVSRPTSTISTPVLSETQVVPSQPATPHTPLSTVPSPALSQLPSLPRAAQQFVQRKRPVAADFMDYPPTSIKRPSLANRQNSSFVINVSDDEDHDEEDEDEDEDVEMEVDSAEDSPVPTQSTINLPRRGPSIRDYPPLTNKNPARHVPSPAPGTPTAGGKTANVNLQAREREIEELKQKIQEAEARAKAKPTKGSATPQTPSVGNITPTEQLSKPPMRRAVSSNDMNQKNNQSVQLPRNPEAVTTQSVSSEYPIAHQQPGDEGRARVLSAQLPVKSDKVREKAERLKRMQEEMMRLQAEIDEDMAEDSQPSEDIETDHCATGVVAPQDILESVEAVTRPDLPKSSDITSRYDGGSQQLDDVSRSQSVEIEVPDNFEKMEMSPSASEASYAAAIPVPSRRLTSPPHEPPVQENTIPGINMQTEKTVVYPSIREVPAAAETSTSDEYEPPEAETDDQIIEGLPQFNPAPAEVSDNNKPKDDVELQKRLTYLRNQITSAKVSNKQPAIRQHAEKVEMIREAADDSTLTPHTSFVPYDSPLRYFRAYRFHPQYSESVAGGLKSLTYSNRINPKTEMCPDELDGTDCPRGDACQFQHFKSIVAPDNEIILDLGSSDDLTGEQKKNFNNGLRELVATFQQSKIRDFRTIAQSIVEFRRRFLGDPSKVLRLEGIAI